LALAGGVLLLWISWKRELRTARVSELGVEPAPCIGEGGQPSRGRPARVADVSMSLDNVLAVARTARDHLWVLAFGLALPVVWTAIASAYIALLLARHTWISWLGLGIVAFAAVRMIWSGSIEILIQPRRCADIWLRMGSQRQFPGRADEVVAKAAMRPDIDEPLRCSQHAVGP
jgi:Integral membrane protein TerC family